MMQVPLDALRVGCVQQLARWGVQYDESLLDDLVQEAYLYVAEHAAGRSFVDERDLWKFTATYANYATMRFLAREWRERHQRLESLQAAAANNDGPGGLRPDVAQTLAQSFLRQRRKQGQRGAKAAALEVHILDLILAGYSDDGIALETGLSPNSIKTYRRRIRQRLRKLALDNHRKSAIMKQDSSFDSTERVSETTGKERRVE